MRGTILQRLYYCSFKTTIFIFSHSPRVRLIVRAVLMLPNPPMKLQQLGDALKVAWDVIPQVHFIRSVSRRTAECIWLNGAPAHLAKKEWEFLLWKPNRLLFNISQRDTIRFITQYKCRIIICNRVREF